MIFQPRLFADVPPSYTRMPNGQPKLSRQVSLGDFRRGWEQMGAGAEVLEKFALGFKRIEEAATDVEDFLGMQSCDGTGR